jgi:hypothetical protein
MRVKYVLTFVVGLILLSSCTPEEQAIFNTLPPELQSAVVAVLAERHNHPFLVCVRAHESDTAGGYSAENPTSTASGAYQFLSSSWRNLSARAGYSGWPTASSAPWHIQDAVAYDTAVTRGQQSPWNGTGC